MYFRNRCEKNVFLHTSGHTKFVICNDSPGGIVVLLLFRSLPPVQTGTISSGPVKDTKNLKICPGREQSGPQNKQVPFTQNQTPTHTTGLKIGFFPMAKDRNQLTNLKPAISLAWLDQFLPNFAGRRS